jgi:hypothetical protein
MSDENCGPNGGDERKEKLDMLSLAMDAATYSRFDGRRSEDSEVSRSAKGVRVEVHSFLIWKVSDLHSPCPELEGPQHSTLNSIIVKFPTMNGSYFRADNPDRFEVMLSIRWTDGIHGV